MTSKSDFTEEEWVRVRRAPFVAGMAISLADPGGPIELAKESMAAVKTATNPPSREQLLADVALDIQSMTQQRQNPLSDFKVTDAGQAGQQILDELRAVKELVTAKATPEEASAFGQWLPRAHRHRRAAKEAVYLARCAQITTREAARRCARRRRITIVPNEPSFRPCYRNVHP